MGAMRGAGSAPQYCPFQLLSKGISLLRNGASLLCPFLRPGEIGSKSAVESETSKTSRTALLLYVCMMEVGGGGKYGTRADELASLRGRLAMAWPVNSDGKDGGMQSSFGRPGTAGGEGSEA